MLKLIFADGKRQYIAIIVVKVGSFFNVSNQHCFDALAG